MEANNNKLMSIVSQIIKADSLQSTSKLTNAEKAFELRQAVVDIYSTDGETVLLAEIEKTVLGFPAGKVETMTLDAKTGEHKAKKKEFRDIAKNCFKTAWKNSVEELGFSKNYTLKFKLSVPEIDLTIKTEKTLSDQLAKLLGDTVDTPGLNEIVRLTETVQALVENDKIKQHAQFSADQQIAELVALVDVWKISGVTTTMCEQIAASKFNKLSDDTICDTIAANW